MTTVIRPVGTDDLEAWVNLRHALWAGEMDEHRAEVAQYFIDGTIAGLPHAVFVAEHQVHAGVRSLAGFAECSLRTVAPENTFRAGAHLEGWYVEPTMRRRGVGRRLIDAVRDWARSKGCTTLTSDTSSSYAALSTPAHLACGFQIDPTIADRLGPPEDGTTPIGFSRSV